MKFYNDEKVMVLHGELQNLLHDFRTKRNFDVKKYVQDKISSINQYMKDGNLKACVIAISGGIDSAITYALIHQAMKVEGSPIEKVIPIFLPVYNSEGATNQDSARKKADELIRTFSSDEIIEINLSSAHSLLKGIVDDSIGIKGEAWASGQLVSYLRTPTYYYVTSLMSQIGLTPIICGTTNKDEGAYLGYFGKASDGMVDVQMISDIHKSEVYLVAKHLGVPESIIGATPTGDMYDNRSDEEVFGAPYDFVELYLHYLNLSDSEKYQLFNNFSFEAIGQFGVLSENLDNLHKYNKHKYLGCSPAVHLDVLESKVNGGWMYNIYQNNN